MHLHGASAPFMLKDLNLSDAQMGLVFSAFTFAYAVLEIPRRLAGGPFRAAPR